MKIYCREMALLRSIIEIYKNWLLKFLNGLSSPIMNEIFTNGKTHNYNLRQEHINDPGNIRHVFNSTEIIRYRAQKTW